MARLRINDEDLEIEDITFNRHTKCLGYYGLRFLDDDGFVLGWINLLDKIPYEEYYKLLEEIVISNSDYLRDYV